MVFYHNNTEETKNKPDQISNLQVNEKPCLKKIKVIGS